MARTLYAGRTGDTVLSRMLMGDGRIVVGVPASAGGTPAATTLTVWDEPDGTDITDQCLAGDGVTPITELVVPAGEIQIPAFYGPEGVTGDLWLKDPDGDYSRLDIGPQGPAGPPGADGTGTVNSVNGQSPDGAGAVTVPASAVGSTATGNLAATNVQAALAELDAEKQPIDTDLTAIAALVSAANKLLYATGPGAWSLADLTAFARTLLDDADAAAARATIEAAGSTGGGREKSAALSATTGTATGDLSAASIFTVTPTGNITLAFSNVPATGTACTVTVIVSQGGTVRTVTPPSGTKWMGAAPPTQVANKACAFTFLTVDGGTTWYASAAVEQ